MNKNFINLLFLPGWSRPLLFTNERLAESSRPQILGSCEPGTEAQDTAISGQAVLSSGLNQSEGNSFPVKSEEDEYSYCGHAVLSLG